MPEEEIVELYEHECAELAIRARITKFLHIFAIRNVRERLRKRALDSLAKLAAGRQLPAAEHLPGPRRWPRSTTRAAAEKQPRP